MTQPITTAHAIRTDDVGATATKAAATWDAEDGAVYDDGQPWEDDPAEDPRATKATTKTAAPSVVTGHALRR